MIEMLAAAMNRAGSADPVAVARALEGLSLDDGFHASRMRAQDHQLIQPLYVMEMDKVGTPGVRFDNEAGLWFPHGARGAGAAHGDAVHLLDDAPVTGGGKNGVELCYNARRL